MSNNPFQDVAIVAAYNTQQARRLENHDDLSLLAEVIQNLFQQSQLSADDIDGINISSAVWNLKPREALSMLGGKDRWCGNEFMGIAAVIEAASAIAVGQAETILIACAQAGEYTHSGATAPWTRPNHEFSECFGLYTAAEFALCAQRHMAIYGTPASALAEVAATIRSNGHYHPQAQFYNKGLITPEQVLASRMICSPFRLFDCCITSEGAGGLIITTAERARDMDAQAVYIVGAGTDRQGMSYTRAPVWDECGSVGQRAAKRAFEQAQLQPKDIDVCEFYDPFSFEIIRQFEAFGFCQPGEGADFISDGRIAIDGEFPVATNGGLLSFSHAGSLQMLQKVIVAYEQLSGKMPNPLQVDNPSTAMATNGGSGALFCDVMLLANQSTAA